jgi:hypothetical protein
MLESSDETGDSGSETANTSSSEEEDDDPPPKSSKGTLKFKIPKYKQGEEWSDEQIDNFRKVWPHLKNLDTSALKGASLRDIQKIGNQKLSNSKFLSQTMAANYENLLNFPETIPAGIDDCTGLVHMARFLRGYVTDKTFGSKGGKFWGQKGLRPLATMR